MKSRMNILLAAILVMLGAIAVILVRGPKTRIITAVTPASAAAVPALRIEVQTMSPLLASTGDAVTAPTAVPLTTQAPAVKAAKPVDGGRLGYTAAEGDVLANVVVGLRGNDTKANRAEVMAANPALQADPDRVLAGKTYSLPAPGTVQAVVPSTELKAISTPTPADVASEQPHASSDRVLKYTAQPGDSVSILAAGLLGADSKTNRDAIIASNHSLKADPDLVVAGKTYAIPTSTGLSSAPASATARQPSPATQPGADADDVVRNAAGRSLRYTARAGDNVSKLATALLGSDTKANRDAIVNSNASLKSDPDRVVAGQTYWIPVPAAVVEKP